VVCLLRSSSSHSCLLYLLRHSTLVDLACQPRLSVSSIELAHQPTPLTWPAISILQEHLPLYLPPVDRAPEESPTYLTMSKPSTESLTPSLLTTLPTELLLEIAVYLPTSASVSLKLVNKQLYHTVPIPLNYDLYKLPQCEKTAVRRAINEHKHLDCGRRWCLVCMTLQPLRNFRNDTAVCSWHDARFTRVGMPRSLDIDTRKRLLELSRHMRNAYWVVIPRVLCLHCHTIQNWDARKCRCDCSSCAQVAVDCLVRITNKVDEPRTWELLRPETDEQYISEEHQLSCQSTSHSCNVWKRSDNRPALDTSPYTYRRRVIVLTLEEAENRHRSVTELTAASPLRSHSLRFPRSSTAA